MLATYDSEVASIGISRVFQTCTRCAWVQAEIYLIRYDTSVYRIDIVTWLYLRFMPVIFFAY